MGKNEQVSMHMPGGDSHKNNRPETDVRDKEINSHTEKYNQVSQRPQLTRLTNNVHVALKRCIVVRGAASKLKQRLPSAVSRLEQNVSYAGCHEC